MNQDQFHELLLQSLQHEAGGVQVYETAVECAVNEELKEEWAKYLEHTREHVGLLTDICDTVGLDPETETPGRDIVRRMGESLVDSMERALRTGDRSAAQLVACECVVIAETKDHLDWELLDVCAEKLDGEQASALKRAHAEVGEQENEHLFHTRGWCRELWLESLGLKAVLPPPEEKRHVKTALGAARAERASLKRRASKGSGSRRSLHG